MHAYKCKNSGCEMESVMHTAGQVTSLKLQIIKIFHAKTDNPSSLELDFEKGYSLMLSYSGCSDVLFSACRLRFSKGGKIWLLKW